MNREHPINWLAAAPLWPGAAGLPSERPALLSFNSDAFMDELAAVLRSDPKQLSDHIAQPKSFRPAPIGKDPATWNPATAHLKLYQPVHGQFSLVAASLVCRIPGMPDRAVDRPSERVGFVVRRRDDQGREMAWVVDTRKTWQAVAAGRESFAAPGEEINPLFPVPYADVSRRCLHVGLIPTSSRDTFQTAPEDSPFASESDPRLTEFDDRVANPLAALRLNIGVPAPDAVQKEASMFLLLDFADVLRKNASALGADIVEGPVPAVGTKARRVYAALNRNADKIAGTTKWVDAIKHAWRQRDRITGESSTVLDTEFNLATSGDTFSTAFFRGRLATALGPFVEPPPSAGPVPVSKLSVDGEQEYVIRCVFQRPGCRPPHPDIVSERSEPFVIAPFFDPDAPTRPIRIALPADTSIQGLRKYAKSVAFLTSAKLREQMSTIGGMKDTLDGKLKSGQTFNLGEICSFSIPIITLCAMILLLLIVVVLNIVFWWLPFFRLCFPIKKATP